MRIRQALATVTAVVLTAGVIGAQQERATFILSDGERMSGTVVFHTEAQTNIRADKNEFNLKVQDGTEVPIPFDHVTVIDFMGGQPQDAELEAAPANGHLMALRNGDLRRGRLVDFIRGNTVRWETPRGEIVELPITQVRRIFLKGDRARELYRFAGAATPDTTTATSRRNPRLRNRQPAARVNTDRLIELGSATVTGTRPWTDSGVNVRAGDVLVFDPTGQVAFSRNREHIASPEGNGARQGRERGLPLESAMVGALIGKVGANGRPFLIGAGTDDIQIPATGRLFLGVNDDGFDDNSGAFQVVIYR